MARTTFCRLMLFPLSCALLFCLPAMLRAAGEPPGQPPAIAPEPGPNAVEGPSSPSAKVKEPPARPPVQPPDAKVEERPPSPPPERPRPTTVAYSSPILRLASVPNMLGDSLDLMSQLEIATNPAYLTDLPLAGAGRRVKVADNNKALPMNRCYFTYQHFHNALQTTTAPGSSRFASVDHYTIGLEKTFRDDRWSVDVRMPFTSRFQFDGLPYAVDGGDIGNFAIVLKRLVMAGPCGSIAAGLGIDTPTGSDLNGRIATADLLVENEAVHLSPYVGFLRVPNERLFYQGFLQVDVPTNGNRVQITQNIAQVPTTSSDVLNEPTLLYFDLSAGYWLYRNPCAAHLTGLASILEFHYTTTLNEASVLSGTANGVDYRLGNLLGQVDFVNLTVGLHAELPRCTTVRVAGVFPLENGPEKPFDAEVQVSINRRF